MAIKPVFSSEVARYLATRPKISEPASGTVADAEPSPDYSVHISMVGAQQIAGAIARPVADLADDGRARELTKLFETT